jgi:large subunit ribosomal protein L7/L12
MSSKISKEEVLEWLNNQSVLEINKLIKDLENSWDIKLSDINQPSSSTTNLNDGSITEAKTSTEDRKFDVILENYGSNKINIIKEIRVVLGLGLKEAKSFVESAPKIIKNSVSSVEAEELREKFKSLGADISVK